MAVELKREFCRLSEIVLHIHVYRLPVGGSGGVVEPELLLVKRIAVVGLEDRTVIHLQYPLAGGLEITDGVACILKPSLPFERASPQ